MATAAAVQDERANASSVLDPRTPVELHPAVSRGRGDIALRLCHAADIPVMQTGDFPTHPAREGLRPARPLPKLLSADT